MKKAEYPLSRVDDAEDVIEQDNGDDNNTFGEKTIPAENLPKLESQLCFPMRGRLISEFRRCR